MPGIGLLQIRDRMDYVCCKKPENIILKHMSFAIKSISRSKWIYSNIELEMLQKLQELENFHQFCFAREVNCNNWSQTSSCDIQKGHGDVITMTTMHSTLNTSILDVHNIQTRMWFVHNWLSSEAKVIENKITMGGMKLSINAITGIPNIPNVCW